MEWLGEVLQKLGDAGARAPVVLVQRAQLLLPQAVRVVSLPKRAPYLFTGERQMPLVADPPPPP